MTKNIKPNKKVARKVKERKPPKPLAPALSERLSQETVAALKKLTSK